MMILWNCKNAHLAVIFSKQKKSATLMTLDTIQFSMKKDLRPTITITWRFSETVKMHNWLSSLSKNTCWIDIGEIDILASCQLYLTGEKSSFLFHPPTKRFMEKSFFFLSEKNFLIRKSFFFQLKFFIRVYGVWSVRIFVFKLEYL